MTLQEQFADAQAKAKTLPAQSNETLLELYSLYKQATEGDVQGDRPGGFDLRGAAKYDAWKKRQGMTADEAMQAYVDLVARLGS
jgi:acyl-CoA-binding protein